jgi:hypothetical protein
MSSKPLARLALVALALLLCACTPWVKPYQRQHLADEVMSFDRDPVATGYFNHVHEAREAARGADGGSGGGCGCN